MLSERSTTSTFLVVLLLYGERNGRRRNGKREKRGEKLEGGIWPTQKFRRGAPMQRCEIKMVSN